MSYYVPGTMSGAGAIKKYIYNFEYMCSRHCARYWGNTVTTTSSNSNNNESNKQYQSLNFHYVPDAWVIVVKREDSKITVI